MRGEWCLSTPAPGGFEEKLMGSAGIELISGDKGKTAMFGDA